MFKKGEVDAQSCQHEQPKVKEEVEATLRRIYLKKDWP